MARAEEGLRSEAMRAALDEALAGQGKRLDELLARHGAMPSPHPNLKLAQAFGAELAVRDGKVVALLRHLSADISAPDTAEVFLPIAAAHGWTHRMREERDIEPAWDSLEQLCADERSPVRVGTLSALVTLAAREGWADRLVARAEQWLAQQEDRELCFGAAALVVEVLSDARVLSVLRDAEALLAYLTQVIDRVGSAPRSAERSDGRRRALTSLALTLPKVVAAQRAGERGENWLSAECERAKHPDVRRMLSDCIVKLSAQGGTTASTLRDVLAESAKPVRDPTLRRQGTGRGKQTRRTR